MLREKQKVDTELERGIVDWMGIEIEAERARDRDSQGQREEH